MEVLEVIMEVCSEDMIMGLEVMEVMDLGVMAMTTALEEDMEDLEDIMTMIMTFLEAVARKSIKTKRTNIRGIMDSVKLLLLFLRSFTTLIFVIFDGILAIVFFF